MLTRRSTARTLTGSVAQRIATDYVLMRRRESKYRFKSTSKGAAEVPGPAIGEDGIGEARHGVCSEDTYRPHHQKRTAGDGSRLVEVDAHAFSEQKRRNEDVNYQTIK